jgi:drug/metabolite transporter (DMT)-like permease
MSEDVIYALFIAPLGGTPALYTSMFGIGLVALLVYSSTIMKEAITRLEVIGALLIVLGTLTIGSEGIFAPSSCWPVWTSRAPWLHCVWSWAWAGYAWPAPPKEAHRTQSG